MITLRHIYTVLFIVGLFFIPFTNFEGLSFLGEYQPEASSYFFLLGFMVLCVESALKGSINLPYNNILFQVVCLFVLWTILATLFNLPTVLDSYYKQTSGISRFIRQFISLTLSAFIFFSLFWNVVRNMTLEQILLTIRKTLLIALVFVFVYGVIETAIVVFGIGQLFPRSEEHTSELQSRPHLVCRLLLEKKKQIIKLPVMLKISIPFSVVRRFLQT